jgi:hypothetical protein
MGSQTYAGVRTALAPKVDDHGISPSPWSEAQQHQIATFISQLPGSAQTPDGRGVARPSLDQAVQSLLLGTESAAYGASASEQLTKTFGDLPNALTQGRMVGNQLAPLDLSHPKQRLLIERLLNQPGNQLATVLGRQYTNDLLALAGNSVWLEQTQGLLALGARVAGLKAPGGAGPRDPAGVDSQAQAIVEAMFARNDARIAAILSAADPTRRAALARAVAAQGARVAYAVNELAAHDDARLSDFGADVNELLDAAAQQPTPVANDPAVASAPTPRTLDQMSLSSLAMSPQSVGAILSYNHGNPRSAQAYIVERIIHQLQPAAV